MATDRLRVVHVLEATLGGTKKHLLDLCTHLDPARFELHALLSPLRDPDPASTRQRLEDAGVTVTHIPMQRALAPLSDLRCLRRIENRLRDLRPHVVHTHSAKAGALGRVAAARVGVRGVIYTPHGFPFCMDSAGPLRPLFLWIERRLGRCTTCIVGVCDSERRLAIDARVAPPERCTTIENGIEFAPLPEVDREAKLASLGLPPEAKTILCVGDLRTQKGHVLVLGAMPSVLENVPEAHLLIAGEGALRGPLERMLRSVPEGRAQLLGHREDVPELLGICDVFCQPSLWEGCPYALIEAAGAGRAMVAHDIPGISDIVQDGVTGWPVSVGERGALEAALIDALTHTDDCRRRGLAASRLVRERHSLRRMVDLTGRLYEQVAGRTPSV